MDREPRQRPRGAMDQGAVMVQGVDRVVVPLVAVMVRVTVPVVGAEALVGDLPPQPVAVSMTHG